MLNKLIDFGIINRFFSALGYARFNSFECHNTAEH